MLWALTTTIGSYLYIVLMILPHVIISSCSRTGDIPHIMARYWARFTLMCANSQVEITGEENLPDGPAVYMANHASHFDVFALLGWLNIQFRWTVKKELFQIPLLGLAMKRSGYILIDRSNHARALSSLQTAAEKIANGTSILIFPEGTRSCDGALQYPFKKGGFHLACQAAVPIVPITVIGSREVLPKHGMKITPGKISLKIGNPIPTYGRDVGSLMEDVYKSIKLGYTL
jgi:1-acyl-sn-glycerol-3-phosphate acyltransferase